MSSSSSTPTQARPIFLTLNTVQVNRVLTFVSVNLSLDGVQILRYGDEIEHDLGEPITPDLTKFIREGNKIRCEVFNPTATFDPIANTQPTFIFEGEVVAQDNKRFRLQGKMLEGSLHVLSEEITSVGTFTRQP